MGAVNVMRIEKKVQLPKGWPQLEKRHRTRKSRWKKRPPFSIAERKAEVEAFNLKDKRKTTERIRGKRPMLQRRAMRMEKARWRSFLSAMVELKLIEAMGRAMDDYFLFGDGSRGRGVEFTPAGASA